GGWGTAASAFLAVPVRVAGAHETRGCWLLRKTRHLISGVLRLGGERGGEEHTTRASEERTSVHHWISSSARPSSDGGIVRPRALAVGRLMTNSNFVACSTGRSPGLAPLRIRST